MNIIKMVKCDFCFENIFKQVYKFSAEQLELLLNRANSACIHNSSSAAPFLDFQRNLLLLHRIGNMEYFVLATISAGSLSKKKLVGFFMIPYKQYPV